MKEKRSVAIKVFFFSILCGLVLILVELLLTLFNRSLCPAKGCKIAENLLLIPKPTLLLIALFYFISLSILALLFRSSRGQLFKFFILFLIGLGFTGEWFLILKLLWEYGIKCYFCIVIAGLLTIIALSGLSMLGDDRSSYLSLFSLLFGCLLGVTGAFFISTTATGKWRLEKDGALLVYARGCPRCEELLKDPRYSNLPKIPAIAIYPFLKVVGIETLPVIIERKEDKICVFEPKSSYIENASCPSQPLPQIQGGLCVIP